MSFVKELIEALIECDAYITEVRPAKGEWEDELQARNRVLFEKAKKQETL